MVFSLRGLLGVITAGCILLAAYQTFVTAAAKGRYAVSGCVLGLLAVAIPAVLAAGATGSRYARAAMVGGLVPALLAALLFVAGLTASYNQMMPGHEWSVFWPVIARMVYYRHGLLLLWSLVPVCMLGGIAAHWFVGPAS